MSSLKFGFNLQNKLNFSMLIRKYADSNGVAIYEIGLDDKITIEDFSTTVNDDTPLDLLPVGWQDNNQIIAFIGENYMKYFNENFSRFYLNFAYLNTRIFKLKTYKLIQSSYPRPSSTIYSTVINNAPAAAANKLSLISYISLNFKVDPILVLIYCNNISIDGTSLDGTIFHWGFEAYLMYKMKNIDSQSFVSNNLGSKLVPSENLELNFLYLVIFSRQTILTSLIQTKSFRLGLTFEEYSSIFAYLLTLPHSYLNKVYLNDLFYKQKMYYSIRIRETLLHMYSIARIILPRRFEWSDTELFCSDFELLFSSARYTIKHIVNNVQPNRICSPFVPSLARRLSYANLKKINGINFNGSIFDIVSDSSLSGSTEPTCLFVNEVLLNNLIISKYFNQAAYKIIFHVSSTRCVVTNIFLIVKDRATGAERTYVSEDSIIDEKEGYNGLIEFDYTRVISEFGNNLTNISKLTLCMQTDEELTSNLSTTNTTRIPYITFLFNMLLNLTTSSSSSSNILTDAENSSRIITRLLANQPPLLSLTTNVVSTENGLSTSFIEVANDSFKFISLPKSNSSRIGRFDVTKISNFALKIGYQEPDNKNTVSISSDIKNDFSRINKKISLFVRIGLGTGRFLNEAESNLLADSFLRDIDLVVTINNLVYMIDDERLREEAENSTSKTTWIVFKRDIVIDVSKTTEFILTNLRIVNKKSNNNQEAKIVNVIFGILFFDGVGPSYPKLYSISSSPLQSLRVAISHQQSESGLNNEIIKFKNSVREIQPYDLNNTNRLFYYSLIHRIQLDTFNITIPDVICNISEKMITDFESFTSLNNFLNYSAKTNSSMQLIKNVDNVVRFFTESTTAQPKQISFIFKFIIDGLIEEEVFRRDFMKFKKLIRYLYDVDISHTLDSTGSENDFYAINNYLNFNSQSLGQTTKNIMYSDALSLETNLCFFILKILNDITATCSSANNNRINMALLMRPVSLIGTLNVSIRVDYFKYSDCASLDVSSFTSRLKSYQVVQVNIISGSYTNNLLLNISILTNDKRSGDIIVGQQQHLLKPTLSPNTLLDFQRQKNYSYSFLANCDTTVDLSTLYCLQCSFVDPSTNDQVLNVRSLFDLKLSEVISLENRIIIRQSATFSARRNMLTKTFNLANSIFMVKFKPATVPNEAVVQAIWGAISGKCFFNTSKYVFQLELNQPMPVYEGGPYGVTLASAFQLNENDGFLYLESYSDLWFGAVGSINMELYKISLDAISPVEPWPDPGSVRTPVYFEVNNSFSYWKINCLESFFYLNVMQTDPSKYDFYQFFCNSITVRGIHYWSIKSLGDTTVILYDSVSAAGIDKTFTLVGPIRLGINDNGSLSIASNDDNSVRLKATVLKYMNNSIDVVPVTGGGSLMYFERDCFNINLTLNAPSYTLRFLTYNCHFIIKIGFYDRTRNYNEFVFDGTCININNNLSNLWILNNVNTVPSPFSNYSRFSNIRVWNKPQLYTLDPIRNITLLFSRYGREIIISTGNLATITITVIKSPQIF